MGLIMLIIFGDQYNLWHSSLYNLLQSPDVSRCFPNHPVPSQDLREWLHRFTEIKTFYSVSIAGLALFPVGTEIFLSFTTFRQALGPTQPPIKWFVELFPQCQMTNLWNWPLTLFPRTRMRGTASSLPLYVFMTWCVIKERNNFAIRLRSGQPKNGDSIPQKLEPT
jgi:hypothetical protein